ncbi:MAG: pyruvate, phosphate dikinase [Planctomycetota bacterium]|nr:pyruvate, phosphate dikinase [Planctomycetota bacterium]
MKRYLYYFGGGKAEGRGTMKDILGGKGAGIAEMTNIGLPVPPGFTISTEVCRLYYEKRMPKTFDDLMMKYLARVEKDVGAGFGDPANPLLVSVRSGSKFSMPGMMDTILNLGLNDKTVVGLAKKTGNERFAYDCYRRFIAMFSSVVLGIEKSVFESALSAIKAGLRAKTDTDLSAGDLHAVVAAYKVIAEAHAKRPFPQDPVKQLKMARDAVFKSWNNPRAIEYRRIYRISASLGTAVNVQAMVFGNSGDRSATGVGFTRNPGTGEKQFFGEYLTNAQGEDVVAGIRTPRRLLDLGGELPAAYKLLHEITSRLEKHYRDVQDFEFTIENDRLFMLQTRNAKRTGLAAIKIACDMVAEKLITPREALMRVDPEHMQQVLHPIFDSKARSKFKVIAVGLSASPGAAAGHIVFDPDRAVELAAAGERTILVRPETSPDDIHGMYASKGFLTSTGGMTSHAAVVGRQMGKPAVVGCGVVRVDETAHTMTVGDITLKEMDYLSIDGATGEVMVGDVPLTDSEVLQVIRGEMKPAESELCRNFESILKWADKARKIGVRANADIPRDAVMARKLGAEGIGLCRTEHMFFAEDRLPIVQEMILARTDEARNAALQKLLPMQRSDFKGLLDTMNGLPVTIRTLDPPLHEFLPKREELMVEIAILKTRLELGRSCGGADDSTARLNAQLAAKEQLLRRVEELHEFNPMLGHRGCRLGITFPAITEMQVRAIFEAACELAREGKSALPEIMIPLVGHVTELAHQKAIVLRVAEETMKRMKVRVKYKVGTMIEVPRAAVTAGAVAGEAEFFSFGTNDLTQMTFGFSRDDAGKFLPAYVKERLLEGDPFVSVDREGVGALMRMATQQGRKVRKDLKVGICGEHGGDPRSVEFCHEIGLNYVSCSPFRVPVARLAAAQAALAK